MKPTIIDTPVRVSVQPAENAVPIVGMRGFVDRLHANPNWCHVTLVDEKGKTCRTGTIQWIHLEPETDQVWCGLIAHAILKKLELLTRFKTRQNLDEIANRHGITVAAVLDIAESVLS